MVLGNGAGAPGSTVSLPLSYTSASGNTVGLQWRLSLPAAVSSYTVQAAPAAIGAGKSLYCQGTVCLLTGLNFTSIPNGVIATITLTLSNSASGSVPIQIGGPIEALLDGSGGTLASTTGTIAVTSGNSVVVSINPPIATLAAPSTQQFTAAVSGSSNTSVTWSINPALGTISASGLYTAAAIDLTHMVTVTATSVADPTKVASAVVTLLPQTTVALNMSPAAATLNASKAQQFTAAVTGSSNTSVTWSMNPAIGTLSGSGLYTAPASIASAQSVTVTATSVADTTKAASAVVTLQPQAVVALSVTPATATLTASKAQQFTAAVTGSSNTSVTWSMNPAVGTLSASGLYTAPASIASTQTVTVTATSAADTSKAANAVVTLQPQAVVAVSVTPATATLTASKAQQFTAAVTGSSNTSVTWSMNPAVGTLSASGLYTAPASIASTQTVTVTATSAADTSKTAAAVVTLQPAVVSTMTLFSPAVVPTGTSSTNSAPVELGVRFQSDLSGYITGLRFYKAAADSSAHTGSLWAADGSLLASGTFTNETISGWQQLMFATPVPITANTIYIASYHTSGAYFYTSNYFLNKGIDNGPLHAAQNSFANPNGVYVYSGGGQFPNHSMSASNYWADAVFSTTAPSVSTKLSLLNSNAAPEGMFYADPSSVELGVKFRSDTSGFATGIRFYKDPSDIGTHTGSLWTRGGQLLASGTFLNETATGWQQLTFDQPVKIDPNTTYIGSYHTSTGYFGTVGQFQDQGIDNAPLHALKNGVDGPNSVYVYSGSKTFPANTYASTNYSVDVTFATSMTASVSGLYTAAATPAGAALESSGSIELGVKMKSDVPGFIRGIRFYKPEGDSSVHTGSLWTANGQLLATGTFTSETATGWQTLTFQTPVAIAADTVYIASYHTGSGYLVSFNGPQDLGADNGPLHALRDGADGPSAMFIYGPPGVFPSQTRMMTRYWVDVVFSVK
jgi:hypothetical protein